MATLAFDPAIIKEQSGVELLSNLVSGVAATGYNPYTDRMNGVQAEFGRAQPIQINGTGRRTGGMADHARLRRRQGAQVPGIGVIENPGQLMPR